MAGSGKSTAEKVEQQFCYDFCLVVGVMWSDTTFLFTTHTGAAASLFGGVTISKATFLNQQKVMSLNNKHEWQDVLILIVDEVSFMSDKILETLDVTLKEIGNRAKPFGGFSIIFAGDFCQLETVGSTKFYLMISSLSSKHWDNCISTVKILNNNHCFKEDPEYGQMLKRMWNGDLSTEDRKRINTRVIGYNGLQLPSLISKLEFNPSMCCHFILSHSLHNQIYFKEDLCYACPTNKERNSIQAAIIQKHIEATHPTISSNEMPPYHTLIIKANIISSLAKNSNHKFTNIYIIKLLQLVGKHML